MTPEEREAQRVEALNRANEIRLARAALIKQIKAGERMTYEVIEEMPDYIHSMRLVDLLGIPRHWSQRRAAKWLSDLGWYGVAHISEFRKCGDLTDRERRVLIERLKAKAKEEQE